MFFEGFTLDRRSANGKEFRLRRGGEGPPLLLLHGNPQTHAKRAMAADLLALMQGFGFARFAVVAHDRGARVAQRMALDAPEAVERL
jgi:haloacetate dehalogenase